MGCLIAYWITYINHVNTFTNVLKYLKLIFLPLL